MKIQLPLSLLICCQFLQLLPVNAQRTDFIENKGQWNKQVKFLGNTGAGSFYVLDGGYKVAMHSGDDLRAVKADFVGHADGSPAPVQKRLENQPFQIRSHAYSVSFEGAAPGTRLIAGAPAQGINNYFIGDNPAGWAQGCRSYSELIYTDIYPGIDIWYHTNGTNIGYDFLAHPGADISKIKLHFTGIDGLSTRTGKLVIGTSLGDVEEQQPYSYQESRKGRIKVPSAFVVEGNSVRFRIGEHDKSKMLVIDPEIVFSSFTGSTSDNWGYAATYDSQGNFYAAGIVFGNGYPVSNGSYQTQFAGGSNTGENGGFDIGIFKFDATGTQRLYATYLGASIGNELPSCLLVDAQDNLVINGRTTSSNFPMTAPKIGTGGGWDIFISKLSSNGSVLLGSRVIGGYDQDGVNIKHTYAGQIGPSSLQRAYGDAARSDMAIDSDGNIYVGSTTSSTNFPTSTGAFQPSRSGLQDAVVLKFNPGLTSLLFSSCLGGSGDDAIYGLTLSAGSLYIAGGTTSPDFPGNKTGTVGPVFNGGICDGFLAKVSLDGSQLTRSAFVGTTGVDQVYGIDTDAAGNIYLVGTSTGNMPVINAAFSQTGGKQFIAKLPFDFSGYLYATVFGTNAVNPNIVPTAFMADRCGNVYVAGWGGIVIETNPPFPISGTTGLTTTANALQSTTDGRDFYIFVLAKDATAQLYGSFFGQNSPTLISDHSDGGKSRFSKDGTLYLAICANCQGGVFPTTPGAWATTNTSGRCAQAAIKMKLDFATCAMSPLLYVDQNASGLNDGSSWANAYTSLAAAIGRMNAISGIDSILVAAGTYTPAPEDAFIFSKPNSVILGGYPTGGGTRDPAANVVILQGEVRFMQSVQFDGFKLQ